MSKSAEYVEKVGLKSQKRPRLGFVGVGEHAQRLADALVQCGAEIVCHDRASDAEGPTWAGERVPWREMVDDHEGVDAVVAVAPPDVTGAVFDRCWSDERPCLATKPLYEKRKVHEVDSRNFHVDLWRLHSPAWLAMKAELKSKTIESIEVTCVGDGPVREFSGVLDYGPHALAFVGDLLGSVPQEWEPALTFEFVNPRRAGHVTWQGQASVGDTTVRVVTGNDWPGKLMAVIVRANGVAYEWFELFEEQGFKLLDAPLKEKIVVNTRDYALRAFCRSWLAGEPSDSLRLSIEGMRVLQRVAP